MEAKKTFESYIHYLMDNKLTWDDFDPDKSKEIAKKFRDIFFIDHPYWKPKRQTSDEDHMFTIEFKKYGNNRVTTVLCFFFTPVYPKDGEGYRTLELSLYKDREPNPIVKNVEFARVWRDHTVLITELIEIMNQGLNSLSQTQ